MCPTTKLFRQVPVSTSAAAGSYKIVTAPEFASLFAKVPVAQRSENAATMQTPRCRDMDACPSNPSRRHFTRQLASLTDSFRVHK